jgi:hypothetical protein
MKDKIKKSAINGFAVAATGTKHILLNVSPTVCLPFHTTFTARTSGSVATFKEYTVFLSLLVDNKFFLLQPQSFIPLFHSPSVCNIPLSQIYER